MQRPYLVYVGGDDTQPISYRYLGTDGEKAEKIFTEEGNDGSNSIVRFCQFPEHTKIRTPRRDGVKPRDKSTAKAKGGKSNPPAPESASAPGPAQPEPTAHGDESPSDEDHGI